MSHGATSTQNMTFPNTNNSRSFTNIASASVADRKSMNGALGTTFGGRGNAWGSSSIWSGGLTNGLTSNAATRENSQSRDTVSPTEEIEGKTGSGSLVESSVSEAYASRSSWGLKRNPPSGRSIPTTRYGDNSFSQPRSSSIAGSTQTLSGSSQNLPAFASRPPTVNMNSTASAQPRQNFGSAFSSGLPARPAEQPPFNVYTKFDRPSDPSQRKPDSAIGSWAESTTTPSPSDERRPPFPMQYSRNPSIPTSRDGSLPPSRHTDGSLPPSRHTDDAPAFMRPDYSRLSQRPTPNSSRAPSISSSRAGACHGYINGNVDQLVGNFGQLNMNTNSRPSASYRQTHASNGYNGTVAPPSGRQNSHSFAYGADGSEVMDTVDRYMNIDDVAPYLQHHHPSSGRSVPSFAERYLQSGNIYEFRPGQPYTGNGVSTRSYDMAPASRSPEWQNFTNGRLPSPRSPGIPEPVYIDPRLQQLMAAQLRSSYAMYNHYTIPNPIQLNAVPPYMDLLPLGVPMIDAPVGVRDAPSVDGVQSALMYEFKSNTKSKRYELRDIYDHIAEFSGDQHGSRFIQTKLETANSDEKDRVFREIQPNAIPLMTDVFGNYVIQKFFEHGDQTHKKILANKMRGQVLQLSLQMYGCRVVQKALDHVLVDQQALLISELENHVLRCVKDQNGNHVIQKAIERCPASTIGFIIAAFQGQVQHLSIHTYGCRVIQRCLEKPDLPSRAMIMSELMDGIHTIISDQFGNYVVQHIVDHDEGDPKQRVLGIVMRGLEGYSKHKYASNVVEKCLAKSNDAWRRQVMYTLAHTNQKRLEGEGFLVNLIKDLFGNYVIQKLLDTLCAEDFQVFVEMLLPAVNQAKRTGCGKQVISIDKKIHRYEPYRNNAVSSGNAFHRPSFGLQLPTPPFTSNFNSAATTPPPLTADTQSMQSSGIPSVNGDTVEGAAVSRKGSEQPPETGFRTR